MKLVLDDYLTDVFVETGAGRGDNLIRAMRAGFPEIHGIEISQALYGEAHGRIAGEMGSMTGQPGITLYCGAPAIGLGQVCAGIHHKRATFLLAPSPDMANGGVAGDIGIIRHWFQDTLIAPTVLVSGIAGGNLSLGAVTGALLDLNDEYRFLILDDGTPRNVLAALPPTWALS